MKGLPRWIFTLFGLLALVAALAFLGRQQDEFMPSITNRSVSGLSVFADLLREEGYQVSSYNGKYLGSRKPDLVFCAYPTGEAWSDTTDPTLDLAGQVIAAPFASDLRNSSFSESVTNEQFLVPNQPLEQMAQKPPMVSVGRLIWPQGHEVEYDEEFTSFYTDTQVACDVEENRIVLCDPYAATNQYIDQVDNAAYMVGLVRNVVPKGGTVLFWEGPMGAGNPPSFLEELSVPLARAWGQVLLIVVIVGLTLSVRFGQPVPEWTAQRGTRDMLIAFGDILRRGRQVGLVQEIVGRNVMLRLRRKYGLSLAHSEDDLLKRCTPEEAVVVAELRSPVNVESYAFPRLVNALRAIKDVRR